MEVYVRSLRPRGETTQRRVLDRVSRLARTGSIEGYDVVVWGDRAPPTPDEVRTRAGRFVLDRVTVFQRWAERNGASIDHGFEVRSVDSAITGESYRELALPRLVVAAVRGDRLLGVAPATIGDEHVSVTDYLDHFEASESLCEATPVELRSLARTTDADPADDHRPPELPEGDATTPIPEDGFGRDGDACADEADATDPGPVDAEAVDAEAVDTTVSTDTESVRYPPY